MDSILEGETVFVAIGPTVFIGVVVWAGYEAYGEFGFGESCIGPGFVGRVEDGLCDRQLERHGTHARFDFECEFGGDIFDCYGCLIAAIESSLLEGAVVLSVVREATPPLVENEALVSESTWLFAPVVAVEAFVVVDLFGPESPELYADDFRVTEEHGVKVASVVGLQVLVVGIDGEFGYANFEIGKS